MLPISDSVMAAFHAEGRRTLRPHVLNHWWEDLRFAGEHAGEEKRSAILNTLSRIADEAPDLSPVELAALADLMLVNAVSPPGPT